MLLHMLHFNDISLLTWYQNMSHRSKQFQFCKSKKEVFWHSHEIIYFLCAKKYILYVYIKKINPEHLSKKRKQSQTETIHIMVKHHW